MTAKSRNERKNLIAKNMFGEAESTISLPTINPVDQSSTKRTGISKAAPAFFIFIMRTYSRAIGHEVYGGA